MDDIRGKSAKILENALGIRVSPDANPGRHEIETWDSLKHMEIILLLEDHFGVRFSADQAAKLNSLDEIAEMIGECL